MNLFQNPAMMLCIASLFASLAVASYGRYYQLRMVKFALLKDVDAFADARENCARCILAMIALFMLSAVFAVASNFIDSSTSVTASSPEANAADHRIVSVP